MNPSVITALVWASWIGAAFALIVYFAVLLRRPQWVRLLNGSGLFFCGVALTQAPGVLERAGFANVGYAAALLTVLVLAAVIAQAAAALRNRAAWDGVDRRAEPVKDASERRERSDRREEKSASDRRGSDRRSGQSDEYWDRADRRESSRRESSDRRTGPRRGAGAKESGDES